MKPDELICIGKIVGTYGYKGLVRVVSLTDFPERFKRLQRVKISKHDKVLELAVDSVKPYKNYYLFKFKGIESKEAAADYNNAFLQVDDSQLYPLPEGYFYHFQLKGLDVYDTENGSLGKLKEIIETGANDVYVISSVKFGTILIPAIKDVIIDVDLPKNKMWVKLLPGLLNIEE